MDSLPVLRQQTQNKIRSNLQRLVNEQNKNPADLKLSKCIPSIQLLSQNSENKAAAECARNPPMQQGISKIPVLAKTLCLQTSSGFKQSYKNWEEKPLSGKVKEKKQLTRPVPFNLSNRKKTQKAVVAHKSLTALQSKSQVQNTLKSHLSSVPAKAVQNEDSHAQPDPGAEGALDNMKLLSLKVPSMSSRAELLMAKNTSLKALNVLDKRENVLQDHTALLSAQVSTPKSKPCNDLPQRVSVKSQRKAGSLADKKENMQQDHTALLRVQVLTPKSKPCNDLPQRVSAKSQRKAGPLAGLVRCVQFSPDSDALQSILQNKGVRAGGPLGAMSRDSFCPSNRGTSFYSAQRVPLRKNKAETNGGPVASIKETTVTKGTPQRVCNTKHPPMFMKCYQTPYITHGSRNFKLNLQKLFDADDESIAGPGKDPDTQPEQFSEEATSETLCTEPAEICRNKIDDVVDEPKTLPAQPRESVIMFSSKKLLRVPSSDLKVSAPLDQVSSDRRNLSEARSESSADPAHHSHPSVLHLHKDVTTQKTSSLSSAVVMLRKRFPPLEELRLDDEVSTYTSKSVNAAPRFLPPRPRCENPLASILQFEESTRFIPIGFDCPSFHNSQEHTR